MKTNILLVSIFILFITISSFSDCNSNLNKMRPTVFIDIVDGLREEHLNKLPLLETEFYRDNDMESVNTQRLYDDGSLYILTNFEGVNQWIFFSSVKEEGVKKIQNIVKNIINNLRDEPKSAVGKHCIIYRLSYNNNVREFVIIGANYGIYSQLSKITNILNFNLKS